MPHFEHDMLSCLQAAGLLVLQRGIGTSVADIAATQPIRPKDLKGLEKKVDQLIELADSLGMTAVELSQLIDTRWKEHSDASR